MTSKEHAWTRIAVEFVVIFLGVTLSLAADDWRQNRDERAAERMALGELAEDLDADFAELDLVKHRMQSWDAAALSVWRQLEDPEASEASITPHLESLLRYSSYRPVRAVYIGLRDGGQLGLISDPSLRREIVQYYEREVENMSAFSLLIDTRYADLRTLAKTHLEFDMPDSAESNWPLGPLRFETSWPSLARDPRTRGTIQELGIDAANWAFRIAEVQIENRNLRQRLDS